MIEKWRPVVGFEGLYEISDQGRLRSVPRVDKRGHVRGGHLMKTSYRGLYVGATVAKAGKKFNRYIHRMVLEAFDDPCPAGMEACHWDDDHGNNRLSNLRWGTKDANVSDRKRNGGFARSAEAVRGEKNVTAKLKEEDVRAIKRRFADGESGAEIARDYPEVTASNIYAIKYGKSWSHIT
jgi:hypothetical protein